ncbi:P-type conjugative transfer protein TrbL [Bradyrhizobium elkanii]|uniref:P-type conjugative transfer protein TrbL n=1 Tax=Bradyrhizobium elkanii TaxID=29448 RepID=UPI00144A1EDE|nr:P-type conjugative transfer protein TrbL [Bradyrhizobium elkanii]MCP1933366.1 type IV secretion system protein TrbL [Bradyrhizobium elkanii]MCS3585396.1 type IV secretion system protein TrbL [Bradyrhizobium elkanii]MCS3718971.1 type IV secretion system protein TrbL [Bradyrhizobium elkanii]MCS4003376.1 type IV secretion system protein TrbL [Bradyrhizobium elkanii USDA 61]BBB98538.1 conjugal transfer protein TrbL [Bradyrhizobium elkanii USDA 61]
MTGTGVIDQFLETFAHYIDGGFGLLGSEIGYLATTLVAIDITLAALFWAWGGDNDVVARLVKKTLFVGVFAYLIGNWNSLARIVFESFAGLGLKASGTSLSAADFVRPGKIAQVGLDAGRPILDSISNLMGYISFFENFIQIVVLLFAWVVVLLAFFILAIQLFVTLIEFKLTTLAGFVLIPFGLFGKTAFAAERVLGNVVSSGIKVLVLAVIVGIGSTLFSQFTAGFSGGQPTIEDAMTLVLAALSLLGLGIFGPGIANGLVSGGPQLGAGPAVGTGLAAGGVVAASVGVAAGAAGLAGGALAGAARGGGAVARGTAAAYRNGGVTGVAEAGLSAAASPLRRAAAVLGGGKQSEGQGSADDSPAWAQRMKRAQTISHGVSAASHAVRSGDHGGAGSSVKVSEGEH